MRSLKAIWPARRPQNLGTEKEDATEDPQYGKVGKQKIEDTGPLSRKRMETMDEEFLYGALGFIDRPHEGQASPSSAGAMPPECTFGPT